MGKDIPHVARAAVSNDQSLDVAWFSGGGVLDVPDGHTVTGCCDAVLPSSLHEVRLRVTGVVWEVEDDGGGGVVIAGSLSCRSCVVPGGGNCTGEEWLEFLGFVSTG